MKVKIAYWRHDDGWHYVPEVIRGDRDPKYEFIEDSVGWHCWVYADYEFELWMEENMTGPFDVSFRFNGGDPMYTVHIVKEEDATLFKLRWQV